MVLACADALRAPLLPRTPSIGLHRAPPPIMAKPQKLKLSRNQVDFTSTDHGDVAFGLEGNILGLAPKGDSGLLLLLAAAVVRTQAKRGMMLPIPDLLFAGAFPAYLLLCNWHRFLPCSSCNIPRRCD